MGSSVSKGKKKKEAAAAAAPEDARRRERRAVMRDTVTLVSADKQHYAVPRRGLEMSHTLQAADEANGRAKKIRLPAIDGATLQPVADYLLRHALADTRRFRDAVHLAQDDRRFSRSLDAAGARSVRQAARGLGIHPLVALCDRRLDELGVRTPASEDERRRRGSAEERVRVVCLTGGPCGGKSTVLQMLTQKLEDSGFDVYLVNETPTLLIQGGCAYPGTDEEKRDELIEFETALIRMQMQMEDSFRRVAASTGRPSVVFCDRALMDVSAYLPPDLWRLVLETNDMTESSVMERYHMVLHLVTTADGAESFYTLSNNTARRETAEEARELDRKIASAWEPHHNFLRIDNSSGWDGKLRRVLDSTYAFLGVPPGSDPRELDADAADEIVAAAAAGEASSASSLGGVSDAAAPGEEQAQA